MRKNKHNSSVSVITNITSSQVQAILELVVKYFDDTGTDCVWIEESPLPFIAVVTFNGSAYKGMVLKLVGERLIQVGSTDALKRYHDARTRLLTLLRGYLVG